MNTPILCLLSRSRLPLVRLALSATAAAALALAPVVRAQTPAASPAVPTVAPAASADVLGVIETAGNFKTLLKAIQAAGLTETLKKPGPYTLFAPTDEAFSKLPAGKLDELLKPENKAKLVTLLTYHVSPSKMTAAEISKADEVKTLEGTELDPDASADGKTIVVDDSKITSSDLAASNGFVQVIDKVLSPE